MEKGKEKPLGGKQFANNPRSWTAKQKKELREFMDKFGDLSGVILNRESGEFVGGNNRALEMIAGGATIAYDRKREEPTKTGTIAEGWINYQGERWAYREVMWDERTAQIANLVANHAGGDWDLLILGQEYDKDVLQIAGFIATELAQIDREVAKAIRQGEGGKGDGDKPEVEFSEELMLDHNYVVLYFDNSLDFRVAEELFDLGEVRGLIPRKGQQTGVGRVIQGKKWLEVIRKGKEASK